MFSIIWSFEIVIFRVLDFRELNILGFQHLGLWCPYIVISTQHLALCALEIMISSPTVVVRALRPSCLPFSWMRESFSYPCWSWLESGMFAADKRFLTILFGQPLFLCSMAFLLFFCCTLEPSVISHSYIHQHVVVSSLFLLFLCGR